MNRNHKTHNSTESNRSPAERWLADMGDVAIELWQVREPLGLLTFVTVVFTVLWRVAGLSAFPAALAVVGLCAVAAWSDWVRSGVRLAFVLAVVRVKLRHAHIDSDLPPVRVLGVSKVPAGKRVEIRVPRGLSVSDVSARHEHLAACLRMREVRVSPNPDDASRASILLAKRDPLAELAGMRWPWLGIEDLSLWDRFPVGIDEDGGIVMVSLLERSLLLGGSPGGGKSGALLIALSVAVADPMARLWLLDPKMVELSPFAQRSERFVGPEVAEAIELLEEVQAAMDKRYADLLASGKRKIDRASGLPLHVVVCDELAFYCTVEDRKLRTRFIELLRDVVSRGRAAGIIVVAATQKPSTDVIPSSLRDLFGFRLAFRAATPEMGDTVLGQGWASRGFDASTIPLDQPGVGFLLADDGIPGKLRTYWLDDDAIAHIAHRFVHIREAS
jgi:hypothetical protein